MQNMEKLRHLTIKGVVEEDGGTTGVANPQIEDSETIYSTSYWAKPNSHADQDKMVKWSLRGNCKKKKKSHPIFGKKLSCRVMVMVILRFTT